MRFPAFSDDQTAYDVLGVEPTCSQDELKSAFRRLSREHHPDMVASRGGSQAEIDQAGERTAEITVAYRLLCDENTRAEYDEFLTVEPEPELDLDEGWEEVDIVEPEPEVVETPPEVQFNPGLPDYVEALPAPEKIPRKTGLRPVFLLAFGIAAAGFVADTVLHWNLIRWFAVGFGLWLAFKSLRTLWNRNRRIRLRSLHAGHLYGHAVGTANEAQLEDALTRILWRIPWATVVRAGVPHAPFSHAVVAGNRIALFRSVPVDAGTWSWQGPTLVSPRVFNWVEGPSVHWENSAYLASTLRRVDVRQTVVLIPTQEGTIAATNGDGPVLTVIDRLDAVTNWLAGSKPEVRHDAMCDALDLLLIGVG